MLDWNDLRYFLAVARHGSTLAAAKALGVSQPTVQRRLAALEHAIGRALVERLPTGYRLTALGTKLRAHVERIEEGVAAFERELAASDEGLTGTIRVTCAEGMAERFLAPLIAAFQARHPGLRVDLVLIDRYLDLAKGEADVAVRGHAPGDDGLVARKLSDLPWAVYASRAYVERRGRPGAPEELDHHAVIACTGEMANNHAGRWLRAVAPKAPIAASGGSLLGMVAAVRSGAGLAPLPMMVGEPDPELVRVLGPLPEISSKIFLVTHPDLRRAPRVRAFCDFVAAEIGAFLPLLRGEGATA